MEKRLKFRGFDLIILGLIVLAGAWFRHKLQAEFQYDWNWPVIPQYILRLDAGTEKWVPGLLMQGIFITLKISVWAILMALVMGTSTAFMRTGTSRFLRMMGTAYVGLVRNIPILVWMFMAYYFVGDQIIPALGLDRLTRLEQGTARFLLETFVAPPSQIPVFAAGAAALAVYEGAYVAEIIRAGIQSIEKGQWEASSAMGFNRLQQMKHIILPQAFKNVLPPLAGQMISTIKDSAIVSVISIQELTFQGMELMAATFLTFEIWITIMAAYFLLCFPCSLGVTYLEKTFSIHRTK